MGDWWIDDAAPYGGPPEQLTLKQLVENFNGKITGAFLGSGARAVTDEIIRVMWSAGRRGGHALTWAYLDEAGRIYVAHDPAEWSELRNEDTIPVETDSMSPREYALYLKKNRNTGPRPYFQFNNRGTKTY